MYLLPDFGVKQSLQEDGSGVGRRERGGGGGGEGGEGLVEMATQEEEKNWCWSCQIRCLESRYVTEHAIIIEERVLKQE